MNSKDKKILKTINLYFNGYNYEELYDKLKEDELEGYKVIEEYNHYIAQQNDGKIFHIFFIESFSICIENIKGEEKRNTIINNIFSTHQIENYFNQMNIINPLIILGDSKYNYYSQKIKLHSFINNKTLTIFNDISTRIIFCGEAWTFP